MYLYTHTHTHIGNMHVDINSAHYFTIAQYVYDNHQFVAAPFSYEGERGDRLIFSDRNLRVNNAAIAKVHDHSGKDKGGPSKGG